MVTAAMKLKDAWKTFLVRKAMTNPDSLLKRKGITLLTKVCLVKAMVPPVVMYGCESWSIKKAEGRRIDAFELWSWRRLLSLLDCKEIKPVNTKGNQSWIFIVRTDVEAEAPILGHMMQRTDSLEKTLMLGKIEARRKGDDRGWDDWMASLTWWTSVWASSRSWWWTGKPGVLQSMGLQRVRHDWVTELKWTEKAMFHHIVPINFRIFGLAILRCSGGVT